MALIQMKDDGGSDQDGNSGKKWLDYRYMVNVMEQARFVQRLDVSCERKIKVQGDINSKVLVPSNWKDMFPSAEIWKATVPSVLWEKTGSSVLNVFEMSFRHKMTMLSGHLVVLACTMVEIILIWQLLPILT